MINNLNILKKTVHHYSMRILFLQTEKPADCNRLPFLF